MVFEYVAVLPFQICTELSLRLSMVKYNLTFYRTLSGFALDLVKGDKCRREEENHILSSTCFAFPAIDMAVFCKGVLWQNRTCMSFEKR